MTHTQQITRISRNEMVTILSEVNTPQFISFVSNVPEKMNKFLDYWLVGEDGKKKKNPNPVENPYFEDGITMLSKKYKIVTGFDYNDSVNGRRVREGKDGDFEGGFKTQIVSKDDEGKVVKDEEGNIVMKDREVWFEMISKGLVTDKKTHSKFYLRYQYCDDSIIGTPEYLHNGDPIYKEIFQDFLTKKNTDSYSNQGLDDTLNFQVCDLSNVLEISMNNERYELTD